MTSEDWAQIREDVSAQRHTVQTVASGHQALNPGLGLVIDFDGAAAQIKPKAGAWQFGLALDSFGFEGRMTSVHQPEFGACAAGQEFTYRWTDVLDEWWINDKRGFEHGFTVSERPEAKGASGPLTFTLDVLGTLTPTVNGNRTGLLLLGDAGQPVLSYAGLFAFDANGTALNAWLEVDGDALRICVEESCAAYPIIVDPVVQQAYIKASNTDAGDEFGRSIAISGDTLVLGATEEDSAATGVNGDETDNSAGNAGAAYVYVRSGGVWVQEAYLKASNAEAADRFGGSVAISGDTIIVGAYGERSSATGVNGDESDNSASGSGAAYVFVRSGGTWTQQAYLKASNAGAFDTFGISVGLSGDTAVIGAFNEDSDATGVNGDGTNNSASSAGAAYVFVRSGSSWVEQAYLKASNSEWLDEFGRAVSISGDTIVVGATEESSSATGVNGIEFDNSAWDSGAAYVFSRAGSTWTQQAYLKASNTDQGDEFGLSVAVSGDTVVVGARREGSSATGVNGNDSDNSLLVAGAAYVFARSNGAWSQQAYLKASNTAQGDSFGRSVAVVRGDTVVVGATGESSSSTGANGNQSNNSAVGSGAAYTFFRSGNSWSQQSYLKASNPEFGDRFGSVVAISGDTAVVSAVEEDSGATGIDGDDDDNSANKSGAAFVFTGIDYDGIGSLLCPGAINSTGAGSRLRISGSDIASDNDITLEVLQLPTMSLGYFLTSTGTGVVNNPSGSAGNVCIASSDLGRYVNSILSSGSAGAVSQSIDLTLVPSALGFVQVMAGDTRYFQFWHRDVDANGMATSNFSSAEGLTFQ